PVATTSCLIVQISPTFAPLRTNGPFNLQHVSVGLQRLHGPAHRRRVGVRPFAAHPRRTTSGRRGPRPVPVSGTGKSVTVLGRSSRGDVHRDATCVIRSARGSAGKSEGPRGLSSRESGGSCAYQEH